jgi:SHS2 domain-containing protein
MMSYEELPHTADIKIRAQAPTPSALFSELFDALMQVMYGTDRAPVQTREISLPCREGYESLLLDFLSEVLFISEVEGIVFSKAEITIDRKNLHATLHGEPFRPGKHSGGTEVKGISYSGLSIRHDAKGYIAEIVFDV